MNFLRNAFEVLRGRQHLSVTEVQCPQRRVEPETGTADGSLQQRGAAGGHSTGLTLPRLPHASSAQQTLGVKTTFLLPFITNRHIKRHLNQPKVLDL